MPLTLLMGWAVSTAMVMAMAATDESDILGYVLNYGVLGLATLAWMTGRIFSKSHVDDIKAVADKRNTDKDERIASLEAIVAAFQRTTREQTLPALNRFADVLETPTERTRVAEMSIGNLDALLTRLEDRLNEDGGKR